MKSIEEVLRSIGSNIGSEHRAEQNTRASNNIQDLPKAQVRYIGYDEDDSEVDLLSIEVEDEVDEIVMIQDCDDNVKNLEALVRSFNTIYNFHSRHWQSGQL